MADQNNLSKPDAGSSYSGEVLETIRAHITRLWKGDYSTMGGLVAGMRRWAVDLGNAKLLERNADGTETTLFDTASKADASSIVTLSNAIDSTQTTASNAAAAANSAGAAAAAALNKAEESIDTSRLIDEAVTLPKIARGGNAGQVLTSQGANANPSWSNPPSGVTSFNGQTGAVSYSPSAGSVSAAMGALGAGEVGTCGLFHYTGNGSPGSTVGGSSLQWASSNGVLIGGQPSGTWRCMGYCNANDTITIWMRAA